MGLQEAFGFTTEAYQLGPNVLHAFCELGDINRTRGYACEDELGEKGVDIFAGFQTL